MPKNLSNVKEDILLVTRQLLKDTGYTSLSIRQIAAKCGVALGTVYNYYNSKNEIVAEILGNEWNLMLRKIEQQTKAYAKAIDKLEIVFNELKYFMNNVHGFWFDTYPMGNDTNMSVCEIKEKKLLLRNQLSEKIYSFIVLDKLNTDEARNICNTISVILIAYSNDNIDFCILKSSLSALIKEIENLK
ncbi:TetR/AcrR family transcriptional regulator [Ruminiclostridium herbifermentans]|uniref:TetR/AcrR family transcriptional regulator n=1 Tax=Ruminiclostridium herbifermentans TaxID=2488810 RepID=A0A4U7JGX4_9FIRM|nr:TetR/AcrR family transcriptional regulator [Ruminiclostridium herbifermentans]QNU67742.1 TetR/AcrR family transcriptional regulator [Ruminiclostridium herbifermentans]